MMMMTDGDDDGADADFMEKPGTFDQRRKFENPRMDLNVDAHMEA